MLFASCTPKQFSLLSCDRHIKANTVNSIPTFILSLLGAEVVIGVKQMLNATKRIYIKKYEFTTCSETTKQML